MPYTCHRSKKKAAWPKMVTRNVFFFWPEFFSNYKSSTFSRYLKIGEFRSHLLLKRNSESWKWNRGYSCLIVLYLIFFHLFWFKLINCIGLFEEFRRYYYSVGVIQSDRIQTKFPENNNHKQKCKSEIKWIQITKFHIT